MYSSTIQNEAKDQQASRDAMMLPNAATSPASDRQQNAPPLFHCELIRFMSPKHAYSLLPNTHFEWSSASLQATPARLMVTALSTWQPFWHQECSMGLPHVSAIRGETLRQLVSPSSKMLQLILSFLKMAFTLYPSTDRKSQYSNLFADCGKLLLESLKRLRVLEVLLTLLSYTNGQAISRWEAMQSSSRKARLMQSRSCPQTFSAGAMMGTILELTKAGYLGMECEIIIPFAAARLQAMKPLECAEDELVYPEGFSSFQATCSSPSPLISSIVFVSAEAARSILESQYTNFPVFIVESQQPNPLLPILGGTFRATHHSTWLPDCPTQA